MTATFHSTVDRFSYKGGMHYMDVPPHAHDPFLEQGIKRVVCRLNDGFEFHCALQSKGDGTYYIALGSSIRKQAGIKLGQTVTAEIWEDTSPYGRSMPEELEELLRQDEEGNRLFQEMKPGLRRGMLYWIGEGKTVDKRIERAIELVERLKKGTLNNR